MADLIKKIKIKKQDGTYTNYIPIGAEAKNVSMSDGTSVEYQLNKKPYYFDTVNDMKNADLKEGSIAITLGYYEINDGGAAEYKIVDSTKNYKETLNNNLYAELIIKDEVNIKQFGAKGDNQTDDSIVFNNAISYVLNHNLKLYIDKSTYLINNMLIITGSNANIYCDGILRTTNNSTIISIEGSLHNIYIHKLQSSNRGGIGLFSKGSLTFTNIIIDNIDNFNKGISLDTSTSPNGGIYYNYIKSNQIIANKCIYLNANNKYINQNYFYMGGLMGNIGIASEQIVESQGEYNGNCFYNCGFENLQTCIDINNFTHNTFKDFRLYESITGPIFINLHNCDRNLFESNITSALLQNQNISDDISTRRRANIFNCFVTQYGSTTSQYCNKLLSYNHIFEVVENIDLPTRYAFGNAEVHINNLNSLNAYNEFSVYNSENDAILYLDEKYNYDNLYSNLKLYISFVGGVKTIKVYDSNDNLIFDLDNYRSQVVAGKTALFKFELYNGKLYPFLVFKTQ